MPTKRTKENDIAIPVASAPVRRKSAASPHAKHDLKRSAAPAAPETETAVEVVTVTTAYAPAADEIAALAYHLLGLDAAARAVRLKKTGCAPSRSCAPRLSLNSRDLIDGLRRGGHLLAPIGEPLRDFIPLLGYTRVTCYFRITANRRP